MSYIDGFVIAVPSDNKQRFIDHAESADSVFIELGAIRVIECWEDDIPDGKVTDFRRAVQAQEDESVIFSWIEWPDKATRDQAMARMDDLMKHDDRFNQEKNPMPFDGKRMIYGGFAPVVEQTAPGNAGVQPYLFFRGSCEEAIAYYKDKLGADVLMMMRFKDNPEQPGPDQMPPGLDDKIMHACLRINGANVMMSDGWQSGPLNFQCMSLSLSVPTEPEADRLFDALAADGTIKMPIDKTFFSPRFGMVEDKFGVSWMIIVEQDQARSDD